MLHRTASGSSRPPNQSPGLRPQQATRTPSPPAYTASDEEVNQAVQEAIDLLKEQGSFVHKTSVANTLETLKNKHIALIGNSIDFLGTHKEIPQCLPSHLEDTIIEVFARVKLKRQEPTLPAIIKELNFQKGRLNAITSAAIKKIPTTELPDESRDPLPLAVIAKKVAEILYQPNLPKAQRKGTTSWVDSYRTKSMEDMMQAAQMVKLRRTWSTSSCGSEAGSSITSPKKRGLSGPSYPGDL